MNFMSKSKSYLLSDEKSVKKRISFGFTNKTVHDKSVSFDNDSNCVLKKVNSHEFLDEIINEESSRQINESSDLEKVFKSTSEIAEEHSCNVEHKAKTNGQDYLNIFEFKPPSLLCSLVSPVGITYRSKLSRLIKNRLNKSQITLDDRSHSKSSISMHNFKEKNLSTTLNDELKVASDTDLFVDKACLDNKTSSLLNKSFSAIDKLHEIEMLSKTDRHLNDSTYSLTNNNTDTKNSSNRGDTNENSNEMDNFTEPDSTMFETNKKLFEETNRIVKDPSISKLSKLNRSISSSILSINKFKKKKNRQSMCNEPINMPDFSHVNMNASTTRKILTSKNLLRQIENLHEQTEHTNNESKTLDILINIYNSELNYLNHLKNALETYAEPLRKFSSLTSQEYNLLFANLEPIISLSCNLSIKLENLINNYSPYDFENPGSLLNKKLFECYEEYINSYSSIVKLLNQKFKQNEIRELCELRQSKSSCLLSLHEILALPLERIIYYQKLESELIESFEQINNQRLPSTTNFVQDEEEPTAAAGTSKSTEREAEFFSDSIFQEIEHTTNFGNFVFNNQSKSAQNSTVELNKIHESNSSILRNKSAGDILNQNNERLDGWIEMKDKSESLANLHLNDQMSDLTSSKLASLASIQQTFPNDDLKLFDMTITPSKFHQHTPSSSSITQTVKSGLEKISKLNLIHTTPTNTGTKMSLFNTIKKSESNSPRDLIPSSKKLSESYEVCRTPEKHKLIRTATITTSADSHLVTTLNLKTSNLKKKASLVKQGNVVKDTSRTPSFVTKHFQIQRRKTFHDIVNIELLNNVISTQSSGKGHSHRLEPVILVKNSSQLSLDHSFRTNRLANMELLEESSSETPTQANKLADLNQVSRTLIMQNHIQLVNQYDKQDRHFFLFNDLLIIAKQKNESHNKLKHRVLVGDIWLADCFDTIYWQYKAESSVVIGWPPAHNFIADFKDPIEKESWVQQLKQLIAVEKKKEEGLHLNIKICYNKDNFGGSEPTQYSECFTKTVQVRTNETAQEIVNRCRSLFGLEPTMTHVNSESKSQKTIKSIYQLWLKTGKNEPLIPLIGHEFPFVIKMNFLREAGRSIKDDDNSLKFILIDKNARKGSSSRSSITSNNNSRLTSNKNPTSEIINQQPTKAHQVHQPVIPPKDLDHKLRKKMFWSRNSAAVDNTSKLTDSFVKSVSIDQSSKKPANKLLNSFKQNENALKNQTRSTSLSHGSSYKHRSESVNLSNLKSSVYKKTSSNDGIGKATSNSSSSHVGAITNVTLKPFYNKLKKSHLFGVRLEKLCGPYSQGNQRLPVQIMNLLEKVADEGNTALMIFRKSASAKLKKIYKDKLDSHQAVDYNEMNVHVAGLLLKEFLRDYPDGIVDYHLYNDCLSILKVTDQQQKMIKTRTLLSKLPAWNLVCLRHFMCLFCCIVKNCHVNKMDSHNLSVCVAPSIFHKLDRPQDVESSLQAIAFIKHLIDNCEEIFESGTLLLLGSVEQMGHVNYRSQSIDCDLITTSKHTDNFSKKQTKSLIHRRELGRMLTNALKVKKSSKTKTKAPGVAMTAFMDTYQTAQIITQQQVVPKVTVNSPAIEIGETNPELEGDFKKIALSKEIRRRTSTNNSDQKPEFNGTTLVINVEDENEEGANDIEANHSFNSEDDELSDQDDYYAYDDHIAVGECSNDDCITYDYSSIKNKPTSSSSSRYYKSSNNSSTKKRTKTTSESKKLTTNPNETTSSVNNLMVNKHDLSSNTLSVDSGLSVPTATNSDPESEKSTHLNIPSIQLVKSNESVAKDELDTSKLKIELEKHQKSRDYYHGDELGNESDKQVPYLKRQRRMIVLNSTNDKQMTYNYSTNNLTKPSTADDPNFYKKNLSESDTYDVCSDERKSLEHYAYNRRISSSRIAPLAPPIIKQLDNTDTQIAIDLVPYKIDDIPLTYQKVHKSTSQASIGLSKQKRFAPIAQVEGKTETESDYETIKSNVDSTAKAAPLSSSSVSSISSKSTSTETSRQKQTIFYSNHSSNRKSNQQSNRKSIVKVSLDNDHLSDIINFNYLNNGGIQSGAGVACDLTACDSPGEGSSTTIYVPYIPKKPDSTAKLLPLAKKNSQRRKLSKTIRDYKPSRQLQRQLSHQQRETKPILVHKLTSHSFKLLRNKKKLTLNCESSCSDRETSAHSSRSSSYQRKRSHRNSEVTRAKSLNAQLKVLSLEPAKALTKRSTSTEVNETRVANIKIIPLECSQRTSSLQNVHKEQDEDNKKFITKVYSNPVDQDIISTQIDICLSSNQELSQVLSSSNSKIQSLSSISCNSITSNQSKNISSSKTDSNNNHSINLNEKTKPKAEKKSPLNSSKSQDNSVEITWSVSSIRKQFENAKLSEAQDSDHSTEQRKSSLTPCSNFGTIKINRHNISNPQSTDTRSQTSFSSVSSSSATKFYNYHDSNGNPITYI